MTKQHLKEVLNTTSFEEDIVLVLQTKEKQRWFQDKELVNHL
jgi:hypothetical protein